MGGAVVVPQICQLLVTSNLSLSQFLLLQTPSCGGDDLEGVLVPL